MGVRKKILMVFGTRPEAIKMAPLFHGLRHCTSEFETVLCATGQHRQMLDQVLACFDMRPDIDLNLMQLGQSLSDVTAKTLLAIGKVYYDVKPDIILVHGDTTTSYAAAVGGFYAGIPIGHVEAGLRTYNLSAPFPEEFNRQSTSLIARWHFAPTTVAHNNLLNEGVPAQNIFITGNTVIDALQWMVRRIEQDKVLAKHIDKTLSAAVPFHYRHEKYVLVTGHRRENFGQGIIDICLAMKESAAQFPNVHFVYPVHMNPQVQKPVMDSLAGIKNVHLIAPLSYEYFVQLLRHCCLVLTDSGGIQEEAPSLGKPVLLMRETTERPEAVVAGTVRLVGSKREAVVGGLTELLSDENAYLKMARAHNPYGDGQASDRIIEILRAAK